MCTAFHQLLGRTRSRALTDTQLLTVTTSAVGNAGANEKLPHPDDGCWGPAVVGLWRSGDDPRVYPSPAKAVNTEGKSGYISIPYQMTVI